MPLRRRRHGSIIHVRLSYTWHTYTHCTNQQLSHFPLEFKTKKNIMLGVYLSQKFNGMWWNSTHHYIPFDPHLILSMCDFFYLQYSKALRLPESTLFFFLFQRSSTNISLLIFHFFPFLISNSSTKRGFSGIFISG